MPYKLFWTTKENETIKTMAKAGASLGEITKALERRTGENGGYPPTKNGDIRSLLCA